MLYWLAEREERKQQITMQKWWVFSFDLKEESEDECLTEGGKVPDHRSDVLKGSLPWGPPAHLMNKEDLCI